MAEKGRWSMATLTCKACLVIFEGRPDRKFCGPKCKRLAEMETRRRKKEEAYKAWLESLGPPWTSLQTAEEFCRDWNLSPMDWGDLPAANWGAPTDWSDLPTADWSDLPTWDGGHPRGRCASEGGKP